MKFELFAEHLIYQLVVFWLFFAMYRIIGFNSNNFSFYNNRDNHADEDLMTTLWYAVSIHTTLGTGDVNATSPGSRAVSALHVLATYLFGPHMVFDLVTPASPPA